jgi:transposase
MTERKWVMTAKEVNRCCVIKETTEGGLTVREAAIVLSLSERQAYRLKRRVRDGGPVGVIHGLRGRSPSTAKSPILREGIRALYQDKYVGFNVSHFTEKLVGEEGIEVSRETARKELMSCGLITKVKKPKHRQRRERMPKEGMLLQMDTSEHDWLMGRGPHMELIAAIDDATNEVPWALFVESDNTINNMLVMKEIVKRKGIPLGFYVDGASHFFTTRHGGTHVRIKEEHEETQIERAIKELGSNLIPAGSPQAKGRIERLFRTFQDRLINEMNLREISNLEDANNFLQRVFLQDYNQTFTRVPQVADSAYIPLPEGYKDLDSIFCLKYARVVRADNTISYKGRVFQILPSPTRIGYTRAKVEVQEWLNGSIHVQYKDQELSIKEIPGDDGRRTPVRLDFNGFLEKTLKTESVRA